MLSDRDPPVAIVQDSAGIRRVVSLAELLQYVNASNSTVPDRSQALLPFTQQAMPMEHCEALLKKVEVKLQQAPRDLKMLLRRKCSNLSSVVNRKKEEEMETPPQNGCDKDSTSKEPLPSWEKPPEASRPKPTPRRIGMNHGIPNRQTAQ
ncbi:unnamed protein product, partial [Darwinula stevensoni]